jgi:hypothetical protein
MGKPKYIETPERMWELFLEYAKETKSRTRPIQKATARGVLIEEHTPPLTIEGFKNYCARTVGDLNRYFFNRDNEFAEYATIVTRIKEEIRQDQIEGSMVGQYNSNLTARLQGLVDKQEVDNKSEPRVFQIVNKGLIE